ncbi:hypothetical protein QBC45DRAFT_484136 [Copromyces sp. CBS 386.78]|nr:hypothetical protein QBC45DRAFT_484136 [Copromyces sp. CBS 386.78]
MNNIEAGDGDKQDQLLEFWIVNLCKPKRLLAASCYSFRSDYDFKTAIDRYKSYNELPIHLDPTCAKSQNFVNRYKLDEENKLCKDWRDLDRSAMFVAARKGCDAPDHEQTCTGPSPRAESTRLVDDVEKYIDTEVCKLLEGVNPNESAGEMMPGSLSTWEAVEKPMIGVVNLVGVKNADHAAWFNALLRLVEKTDVKVKIVVVACEREPLVGWGDQLEAMEEEYEIELKSTGEGEAIDNFLFVSKKVVHKVDG